MRTIFIHIIFLFVCVGFSSAQVTQLNGYFPVNNYTNDDFNSPVQIWTGTQTVHGPFIFGNDKKIISFDGNDWAFVEVDTSKIGIQRNLIEEKKVYKFFSSWDSTIYVSRENSLGKMGYNKYGRLTYIPFFYDSTLQNCWNIHQLSATNLLFTTNDKILSYDIQQDMVSTVLTKEQVNNGLINTSIRYDGKIILGVSYAEQEKNSQFFIVDLDKNRSIQPIKLASENSNVQFRSSYTHSDSIYFVSYGGSVYYLDKKSNALREKFKLTRNGSEKEIKANDLIKHNNHLWVATANHGVEIYNLNGELIREFGEVEGLQDLNVFSLFFDKDDNLWLNLDNGIANIEFSSPTASWDRNQGLEGAPEALIVNEEGIFMATRAGVFVSTESSNRLLFKNTRVVEESCFDIKEFSTDFGKRKLIVGYNGIYEMTGTDEPARTIGQNLYAWELFQSPFNKNEVFIGGEGFLGKLTLADNEWIYTELDQFPGTTIRKFESHNNTIFFSVSDKGVYSINRDGAIKKLKTTSSINTDKSHFYLTRFNDELYAGYTFGLLKVKEDSLVTQSARGIEFEGKEMIIHRLYAHPEKEELWAIIFDETDKDKTKKVIGYFSIDNDQLSWNSINNNSLESGVVMDIQYFNGLLYFATSEGLQVFDRDKLTKVDRPWKVYISSIQINDSLALYNPLFAEPLRELAYGQSIRFNFAGNSFSNNGQIMYRIRIKELSDEWSKYEPNNFKILDNLPHGYYTIEIQGKNFHNAESAIYKYSFTILPPWYFTWWAYVIYVVLFILIIIITTRISVYRVRQKNKLLEEVVQERTKEIAEQNTVLEDQKNQIAAKNEDILDSIKYAKRIQNTILPSTQLLTKSFNEHFVFYRPKDIVSGDFYWMREVDDKVVWAAVDCTGHGVPGAFVSIVGNNGLIRTINEFKLRQPGLILDKLRELVVEAFRAQGERDVKDGMDLALLSLDRKTNELMYAGANNPLVIIRNKEILEFKADKQPVGDFERAFPFTNHTIQLEKGDCVYIFSDGYVDQFGGPKGKKLKSRPFRDLLVKISHLSMDEQLHALNSHFDEWKGELEQLDDVCVFGVKI